MERVRRLVLVRHGETADRSSERLIGSGDPELAPEGREQMRAAAPRLAGEVIDLVVASPLRRSWQAAVLLAGGLPVRLERDLREIDFGRWEGMSVAEVAASDPVRHREWLEGAEEFEFPGGEPRAEFRARVSRGLEKVLAARARGVLLVLHKGVIRAIVRELLGEPLDRDRPALGEVVVLTRDPQGGWFRGRRSSAPRALEQAEAGA